MARKVGANGSPTFVGIERGKMELLRLPFFLFPPPPLSPFSVSAVGLPATLITQILSGCQKRTGAAAQYQYERGLL